MSEQPTTEADQAPAPGVQPEWVVFACDDRLFGVPLLLTREVVPPQPLTRLPGCGPEVAGLMGLRGRVITVFDLGVILGRRPAVLTDDYRVLVLDHEERVAGVAVDAILEIVREEAAALQTPSVPGPAAVVGIGVVNGRQFQALDPHRLLNHLLA